MRNVAAMHQLPEAIWNHPDIRGHIYVGVVFTKSADCLIDI